jgi:hypothetical protein
MTAEHELKFRAPRECAGLIRMRLASSCTADPRFPEGSVTSVYFDTPSFALLREKIDGDCDKRKVRARCYDGPGHAYVEIKYRFGATREKLRLETSLSGERLARCRLEDGDVTALLEPLRAADSRLPMPLHPMLVVRFHRQRFVDPMSGSRVSIDDEIVVPAVNRSFFAGCSPHPLPFAVVEVKGPAPRLPPSLSGLLGLGLARASISKYAECYRHRCRR